MIQENLPAVWQTRWAENHFLAPSLIQTAVFEPLQSGKDVVGISPTGSGKTLAYLLPTLLKVIPGQGNQLLILVSSQELGIQVAEVARVWGKDLGLKVQSLIGGANVNRQIEKLKEKPEVLVGTPGRVNELMKQKKVKTQQMKAVILDEADQLLQQGTIEFVDQILRTLPQETHYAFFSATADVALPAIRQIVQTDLEVIDVTDLNPENERVNHYYLNYSKRQVVEALRRFAHLKDFQGFVFFNQLSELGSAEEKLLYNQIPVASLASDQSKEARKKALNRFRDGSVRQLLTTDLASRGLDVANVPFVINAEVPLTKESYLHRAGRIGRMGAAGTIVTIVQDNTLRDLKRIARDLEITVTETFIYGGELVTELPEKYRVEVTERKNSDKTSVNKGKMTPKEKSFAASSKERSVTTRSEEKKRKKKKTKTAKQKNKGARKKTPPAM